MKKLRFNAEYARACREHCRPLGCSDDPRCWVKDGTAASLSGSASGAPRCAACGGSVRQRRYFSSEGLGTPAASSAKEITDAAFASWIKHRLAAQSGLAARV